MTEFQRPTLTLPADGKRLLLHSCCAPCSGEVMEAITASGIDYAIFFYNPNIHPVKEYELRKQENIRFAEQHGIPFIDCDYDTDNWFSRARGMENEPERGIRCTMCFDMRFERTALYAHEHGYDTISSSLGISRWKNMAQINDCGIRAASRYDGLQYWDYNWRKGGGASRMIEISKREQFYQQEYCGCVYCCAMPTAIAERTAASGSGSACCTTARTLRRRRAIDLCRRGGHAGHSFTL